MRFTIDTARTIAKKAVKWLIPAGTTIVVDSFVEPKIEGLNKIQKILARFAAAGISGALAAKVVDYYNNEIDDMYDAVNETKGVWSAIWNSLTNNDVMEGTVDE